MPQRPSTPCRHTGCPQLVSDGSGYCETHKADANRYDQWRGSSSKRGYDYKWQRFRAQLLNKPEFALCSDCKARGKYTPTRELHHPVKVAIDPARQFELDNIMPLCKTCHAIRTAKGE